MIHLQVYVQAGCASCVLSRKFAAEIAREYNQVSVEIIEIETLPAEKWPDAVFATPTWLWNGQRYSLGTPDLNRLRQQLDAIISPNSLPQTIPKGLS